MPRSSPRGRSRVSLQWIELNYINKSSRQKYLSLILPQYNIFCIHKSKTLGYYLKIIFFRCTNISHMFLIICLIVCETASAWLVCICVCLSVYDAFGKVGSNVVGGNSNQPGLLQQCRSAHGPGFSGQYCQVFLRQVTATTIKCHENRWIQGETKYTLK